MLRFRVPLTVLALVAVPFVAGAAQGRGQEESTKCNADQAAAVARARAAGRAIPPGLAKKDCAQSPAPNEPPPTGPHKSVGVVFDDLDGDGIREVFGGDMGPEAGLPDWTVQLFYRPTGQLVSSVVTGWDGSYMFSNLGNGDWFVCVVAQGTYDQTFPTQSAGQPCGGWGTYFTVSGSFETWAMNDFGQKAK